MSDRSTAAVNVQAQYGLPPNIMFDLLADPTNHANIFDAIEVGVAGAGVLNRVVLLKLGVLPACSADQQGLSSAGWYAMAPECRFPKHNCCT
jgi:hypothetical protein